MVDRLVVLGAFGALILTGYVRVRRARARLNGRLDRLNAFSDLLGRYFASGGQDTEAYRALTVASVAMQSDLGRYGVYAKYKPPHANYFFNSYPVLPNLLPELNRASHDDLLSQRIAPEYAASIREVLDRYSGALNGWIDHADGNLRYPLRWFAEGVRGVVLTPTLLLRSFGLQLGSAEPGSGGLFRALTAVLSLVTLISGLVTIATGWHAAVTFARRLFGAGVP